MSGSVHALHESLELHELLAFKTVCMTKATTMQVLVSSPQLLELMRATSAMDRAHIAELKTLLTDSDIAYPRIIEEAVKH